MQSAEAVVEVLRARGRRGLPCERLYRQLFNTELFLMAWGRIYANDGAMTPGINGETADGMSLAKIGRIIDALRHERYRFQPVKRVYIPKKNGRKRPLGLPSWSDKLVGEGVRILLEAYYEPRFSGRSHGFRPGRGCHTALTEVAKTWKGTTWFIGAIPPSPENGPTETAGAPIRPTPYRPTIPKCRSSRWRRRHSRNADNAPAA